MRRALLALSMTAVAASAAFAGEASKVYTWVDNDGVRHYGDSIPAEYAELDKARVNQHGIPVETFQGRLSEEELEQKRLEEQRLAEEEAEKRENRALLATYLNPEEIVDHRDRRIELFDAQARVTELFLKNLNRRLEKLMAEANRFQPYSDDPDAPMIDSDLLAEIDVTKETIERHEKNLQKFRDDKDEIMKKFDRDLKRFEELKGLTANTGP